jgi:hypothetical protein
VDSHVSFDEMYYYFGLNDTENFECLAFKKLYARIQCFTVDADADIVYTALEGNVDIVDEIVMDI